MSDNIFVGQRAAALETAPALQPVSKVVLLVDDSHYLEAGNDTGRTLELTCPYATQAMADALLAALGEYRYRPLTAQDALLDPAAELGDGVDVGGIYAVLSAIDDDGDGYPGISAPGEEELEDEFPYRSASTRELSNDVDSVRSFVTKSLGAQTVELNSIKTDIQQLTALVQAISNTVTQLESRVSALEGGT